MTDTPPPPRIDLFAERTAPAAPPPRRSGSGRGLLFAGVALVALAAGGLYLAQNAANPERLRAAIEASVSHATGRRFTIAGPLHVTPGLGLTVTAEGISLANLPGASRPDMLTARSLSVQVALLPLMSGDVVVHDATLTGADLLLEAAPDGTPNWQFNRLPGEAEEKPAGKPLYGDAAPDAPREAAPRHGGRLELHAITLQDSHITWHPASGPALALDVSHLKLAAQDADAPLTAHVDGTVFGTSFTGTASTGPYSRLLGGPVPMLAGAWPVTVDLKAGANGDAGTVQVRGGINHPDEGRGYTLRVTANAPDLAPFAPGLATVLPRALALPLRDVNLSVTLTDGTNGDFHTTGLSLHAGVADLSASVPGLILKDAVFSAPGPGQQAELSIQGLYMGAPLRLVGTTTQPDVLAANVPMPLALSGQIGNANFSARGTVPSGRAAQGLDLLVSLRTPTLAELAPLAGRPLPDVKDVAFEAHLGDAGFRLRGVEMRDMSFGSSLGDLSGNVVAAWAPVPTLNGTLTSKHFDIDAAQQAWQVFAAGAPATPPSGATQAPAPAAPPPPAPASATPDQPPRVFSDAPLPLSSLQGADADLTVSAGSLVWGHQTYRDFEAKLAANDGKLILNPLRVTAPEGLMTGAVSLDASVSPPPVAVTLRSPSLSAAAVASLLGVPGGASGAVQIDAQLNGAGTTPHALAASLSGHAGLTMVNGTLSDALLSSALGDTLQQAGIPPLGGSTDVRCLALRADFHHGQGEIQALALDSDHLTLDGSGSVDLADETLRLHLNPTLRLGSTGVASPVLLQGTLTSPKATLEAAAPGGRFALTIGGAAAGGSDCASKLADARGGMPGPMPSAAPQAAAGGKHKKPADLLRGLFH